MTAKVHSTFAFSVPVTTEMMRQLRTSYMSRVKSYKKRKLCQIINFPLHENETNAMEIVILCAKC